jgi:two-component system NtrC family sensor kinase
MRGSLRTKLTLSFLAVIIASGVITAAVGVRLIGDEIIERAQSKVRLDLNSARELYQQNLGQVREIVRLTSVRFFLKEGVLNGDLREVADELSRVRESENLDVLTLTDADGRVILRAANPDSLGDSRAGDPIVAMALSGNEAVGATQIWGQAELAREGADLAKRAYMEVVPTPMARPRPEGPETSGMMIEAASPVVDYDGRVIGVLYGGRLLNRDYAIVDAIKALVYQDEAYKGKETGTATIFQGDLRISTNVLDSGGARAIGTTVSAQVYDQVVTRGIPWVARAFVVNAWYITAYESIKDIDGNIIGMLYVGMLEAPYVDAKRRVMLTFLGITAATVALLSAVVYFTTSSMVKPLKRLLHATEKIAKGYLAYRVETVSRDEIGQLAESFNKMTAELEKTTGDYETLTRTLEDRVKQRTRQLEEAQDQLVQSEKLTSLGKMAAGVAHEINNPLTSILINSHLVAERLKDRSDVDENVKLIIEETTRCGDIVRGLLEFSRQMPPEKRSVDINEVVEDTLLLLKSHVMASMATVRRLLGKNLPRVSVDVGKIKQVFTNIVLNAIEAMPGGGTLAIGTHVSKDGRAVEVEFTDSGCGISKEIMAKIFDPFFSTKATKGTGLGLSVSYGIIQQHRGEIDIRSEVGQGTTVTIRLPIDEVK